MSTKLETAHYTELASTNVEQVLVDAEFWDFVPTQFDQKEQLVAERTALLEVLMMRPAEAFMTEATNFAATFYADRAVATPDGHTRFFTRDSQSQMLDSMTTISEDDTQLRVRHVMFAPITYGYPQPVEITATSDGEFHVFTETYKAGITRTLEVTGTPTAHSIMEEYFVSSLRAAREVQKRDADARLVADEDARARYRRLQASEYKYLV